MPVQLANVPLRGLALALFVTSSDVLYPGSRVYNRQDGMLVAYHAIASLLNLPQKDEPNQNVAVEAVKQWLTTLTRWLLILDNVDDLRVVADFLSFPHLRGYLCGEVRKVK